MCAKRTSWSGSRVAVARRAVVRSQAQWMRRARRELFRDQVYGGCLERGYDFDAGGEREILDRAAGDAGDQRETTVDFDARVGAGGYDPPDAACHLVTRAAGNVLAAGREADILRPQADERA